MAAEPHLAVVEEIVQPIKLWSVTTLVRMALGEGPGLVNWKIGQVAEAAIQKRGLIAKMIEEDGPEETARWLGSFARRRTAKAQIRGTDIHAAVEAIALGHQPVITPEIEPYVAQYRRWLEVWQPTFLLAEAPVYNLTHRYAGTCDGVMELEGHRLLFDYKTTEHPPGGEKKRPPWPEVALQLVAYAHAEEVGVLAEQRYEGGKRYYVYDPTARHEPMPEVEGALCIVISPYDCLAVPVAITEEVWEAWLSVQDVARWQQQTSRGIFKAPLGVPPEPDQGRLA